MTVYKQLDQRVIDLVKEFIQQADKVAAQGSLKASDLSDALKDFLEDEMGIESED